MDKLELITLLRGLIKEEIQSTLQSEIKQFRLNVKKIIKENVRIEVKNLLTEMEHKVEEKQPLTNVISELGLDKKPNASSEQVLEKIVYTKHKKINDLLNETAHDLRTGKVKPPNSDVVQSRQEWSTLNYNTDARTFASNQVVSRAPLLPKTDVEGKPLNVNADDLPEYLKTALTKNYKPLMNHSLLKGSLK